MFWDKIVAPCRSKNNELSITFCDKFENVIGFKPALKDKDKGSLITEKLSL
jgi:hypothetical protein